MGILKRRLNYANPDGTTQTLHLETSADMVRRASGQDVETALGTAETNIRTMSETLAGIPAEIDSKTSHLPKLIDDKCAEVISTIVADSPEAFDTLKEFYDWTKVHETEATDMLGKIADLLTRVAALEAHKATFGLVDIA